MNSKSLPLSFWFHLTSFRVFQGLSLFGWPVRIYELDGAESGVETGVGDPALQILDEDIAQAAVGGPTGQGRAVVCSRVRRQEAGGVSGVLINCGENNV